ncbi:MULTISPECIES: hemin uptake protein HemP [unclassified Aureimonas]|uniref:hemin uptake protein HemP n=1 Tax=unclassified Aureimonas TaxID=2615206 RepID=UPI000A654F2D|nr:MULTISPECIES: hemin uptake protein HemP [unclassified Aureimonas]
MSNKIQHPEENPPGGMPSLRIYTAEDLFVGDREVGIRHAGSLYRLSMTRQGKLILTK